MRALLFTALLGCAAAPKTPASMLAARVRNARAAGVALDCQPGQAMTGGVDDAICMDMDGLTWALCAWNACGRVESCRVESDRKILTGSCGGDGYEDCPP